MRCTWPVGRGSPLRQALGPAVTFHGLRTPFFLARRLRTLANRLEADICHGHLSGACKALGSLGGEHRTVATLHVGYKSHQHARLNGVICVNRAQTERLDGYAGRVRVIYNWIPAATDLPSHAGLRAELGLKPSRWLVGAVGRLHRSKGMDVLIAAFKAVAPADAALVIIGEGPQRAALQRLVGDDPRVWLVGHRGDVAACLRDLDLFVSPSREESFGLAILEAMSAGLPMIATATEGPAEFLCRHPVRQVEPGSVPALAAALTSAWKAHRPGIVARVDYDLREFDPSRRVGEVMEFYSEVSGRAMSPAAAMPVLAAVGS